MKPETISTNFHTLLTLKSIGLSLWMDLLLMCDFITCCIDHLENTDSLNYWHLPSINMLTFSKLNWHINTMSRNHIYSYYHLSYQKSLSIGKLSSSQGWIQVFQNSNFLLKTLSLIMVANTWKYLCSFSLKW